MKRNVVLAITGASGAIYATRLLEAMLASMCRVHLTISHAGALVLEQELGLRVSLDDFELEQLLPQGKSAFANCAVTQQAGVSPLSDHQDVQYYHYMDFLSSIASGSFATEGMVICPCSGGTLSGIVTGASLNLIHRAAEVHLKERRKLVIVPRETPLSQVALDNMQRAGQLGAVVLPAMPGWYHGAKSAADLVDFVVSRILDQLEISNGLINRWGETS